MFWMISLFIGLSPLSALAADFASIDNLDDKRTVENYQKSIDLCLEALAANPNDFGMTWRCARSCRWYSALYKRQGSGDWKEICAKYGKEGMKYAQQAIDLEPNKPNGYYWWASSAGEYLDGVSIFTVVKEGLVGKTRESLEKAYALDKTYEGAGAIMGLGRFWYVIPWPLKNKKHSLTYLREYQKTEFFGNPHEEGPIYLAELLVDLGGKDNLAEAKLLLEKAVMTDSIYYKDMATQILTKIDKP